MANQLLAKLENNVASVGLERFGDKFHLSETLGKRARRSRVVDQHVDLAEMLVGLGDKSATGAAALTRATC